MPRFSIRRLMVAIAGIAVVLVVIAQIDWRAGRKTGRFPNCQRNLYHADFPRSPRTFRSTTTAFRPGPGPTRT